MANEDDELTMVAGVGVGGRTTNRWVRHAREDLQVSHTLSSPLVRWAPEPVESPLHEAPPGAGGSEIAIPDTVLRERPQLRLPEDAVCRSPIAGQVVAVLAAAGERVTRRQPVMVIEAMKMLNHVSPEVDGVLQAVHVAPGDAVKAGQILFELA
jgi:biotin carboxyl carrier protein